MRIELGWKEKYKHNDFEPAADLQVVNLCDEGFFVINNLFQASSWRYGLEMWRVQDKGKANT